VEFILISWLMLISSAQLAAGNRVSVLTMRAKILAEFMMRYSRNRCELKNVVRTGAVFDSN
jgi:hypothetical protein